MKPCKRTRPAKPCLRPGFRHRVHLNDDHAAPQATSSRPGRPAASDTPGTEPLHEGGPATGHRDQRNRPLREHHRRRKRSVRMGRTLAASRRWMEQGTALFLNSVARLDDDSLGRPHRPPILDRAPIGGPRRRQRHGADQPGALGGHGRGDADVLLTRAARDGHGEARRYAEQPSELRQWVARTADELAAALTDLSDMQWTRQIPHRSGQARPGVGDPLDARPRGHAALRRPRLGPLVRGATRAVPAGVDR